MNTTVLTTSTPESKKAGLGFEMKQMLKLLGAQMYKGNEGDVAMKELLQNSFDAVKTVSNPRIDIIVKNNAITIKDNGIGMTTDTVENVYLKIGGTLKDHLDVGDRSGGLGLAKVQFFMTASEVYVQTVKNNVMTILQCTQEELLSGNANLSHMTTDEPNGTTVRLSFPESVEDMTGKKKTISIRGYAGYYDILDKPLLLDGLTVTFNGTELSMGIPSDYDMPLNFSADWGEMVIYAKSKIGKPGAWGEMQVLSAGLYQFNKNLYDLPIKCIINIKPKVKAGDVGYPFNNTREDFNVSVSEDIEVMKKYLNDVCTIIRSTQVQERFSTLIDLDYMDPEANLTPEEREALKKAKEVERFRDDSENTLYIPSSIADEIIREYGHIIIKGRDSYEQKQVVKQATLKAESKIPQFTTNSTTMKFHNNTDGNYDIPGAKEFLEDYSSLIKKAISEPEIRNTRKLFQDPQFVVGISLDKEYGGCFLRGNVNALFLNPLSPDVVDANTFVGHFMHVLIHEMAHHNHGGHDADFCREMADIHIAMYKTGMYGLYEKYAHNVIARHKDTYMKLVRIYNDSCSNNNTLID